MWKMREKKHLAKDQSEENNCEQQTRPERKVFGQKERNRVKKSNNVIGSSLIVPSAVLLFHFSDEEIFHHYFWAIYGVCGKWATIINWHVKGGRFWRFSIDSSKDIIKINFKVVITVTYPTWMRGKP